MKIIRRYKVEFDEKRFVCPKCGCEFLADKYEDRRVADNNYPDDYVERPTCGKYLYWD
jgi:ribosomal protein S27AE